MNVVEYNKFYTFEYYLINNNNMRKSFISFVLIIFTVLFLSSCSVFSKIGNHDGYHPQHHQKKKVKDCGCEVISKLPKTFYIA